MEEVPFREVAADLAELAVTIGLIESVIHQYPEEVQEGWQREKELMRGQAASRSEEIRMFAEAYDKEGDV